MKIVHIVTRLILWGAQENTVLTCLEQVRRGHEVVLLTGPPRGPEGSLLEWVRGMPFRTVLVPAMARAIRPGRDLVAYLDLVKHLREERPDLVHTHSSKAGVLGRRAAAAVGVPCIVHTIHGLAFDAYTPWPLRLLYRAVERRAARWSHRLIAVCRRMAERAAEAGLAPRGAIDVVYSAMDTERFRRAADRRGPVRAGWGVVEEAFVFLKLARLAPMKGHEAVLRAFARVAERRPGTVLVLAGDGPLRPRLRRLSERLGVAGRVRFLGLVPREDVPAVLGAADAVVHASLREGLARVLPQAGLCGRPVVAYDVGGAAEVVGPDEGGVLLPPPAPGASPQEAAGPLAEAMDRLAADPEAARALGRRWNPDRLRPFDYHEATREILAAYARARAGL